MKFQNPDIHRSNFKFHRKVEKIKSKFKNSLFLSKFDRKFPKVKQVIYSSAPTSIPVNTCEISCTQDFRILFSKGHNAEKGHNLDMKKNMGKLFFFS